MVTSSHSLHVFVDIRKPWQQRALAHPFYNSVRAFGFGYITPVCILGWAANWSWLLNPVLAVYGVCVFVSVMLLMYVILPFENGFVFLAGHLAMKEAAF